MLRIRTDGGDGIFRVYISVRGDAELRQLFREKSLEPVIAVFVADGGEGDGSAVDKLRADDGRACDKLVIAVGHLAADHAGLV